jgi:hypothetical protein
MGWFMLKVLSGGWWGVQPADVCAVVSGAADGCDGRFGLVGYNGLSGHLMRLELKFLCGRMLA